MFPLALCLQEGAGVGFQRRHHPPSVLQAKERRAQPLPVLPQNRDVPANAGPALPGDAQRAVSRHWGRWGRGGGVVVSSVCCFQTAVPSGTTDFLHCLNCFLTPALMPLACGVDGCQSNNVTKLYLIPGYIKKTQNGQNC